MTWWLDASARGGWTDLQQGEGFAATLRWLLAREGPDPEPLLVARATIARVTSDFGGDRDARDARLRALVDRHNESQRHDPPVGVPPHLYDQLLRNLGTRAAPAERLWLEAGDVQTLLPHGAQRGPWMAWWGHPGHPGCGYDDRLWAWGQVGVPSEERAAAAGIERFCPRIAWRPAAGGWSVHPVLADAVRPLGMPPRLDAGPGFLLACVIDALCEIVASNALTPRDCSVLWGTVLFPLLARSEIAAPGDRDAPCDLVAPDYLQLLPFFFLHPRVQASVIVLDRLCTAIVCEEEAWLRARLEELERSPATRTSVYRAALDIVGDLGAEVMHRTAGRRWDSGFGFRLFRRLFRDLPTDDPEAFARAWDHRVHAFPEDAPASGAVGSLAERLREALSTAVWFPGRPKYAGGPALRQLIDLAWLRWTDELFLV